MNIKGDFRVFVNAKHSVFFKKHTEMQIKLKPKMFLKIADTFVENAMILMCANVQRKILMFGEVEAPESSFWDRKLKPERFMNI